MTTSRSAKLLMRVLFKKGVENIAWKNSPHFATPPLASPWNGVSGTTAGIPYWWHVTTQIRIGFWLVLPRGIFASTNQKHYPDLGSDASSWARFFRRCFQVETSGCFAKCGRLSHAMENTLYTTYVLTGYGKSQRIKKLCITQLFGSKFSGCN